MWLTPLYLACVPATGRDAIHSSNVDTNQYFLPKVSSTPSHPGACSRAT